MRTVAFLCIVVFILLAAGRWDYAEYEDMALISAIGIDYTEETNHVEITLENSSVGRKGEASQSSQGGEKNKSGSRELYAVDAESIPEAINKLQQAEERELFFGYTQVVVISSEAAEKYMKEILSFLSYTPRIRKSVYLFVTPKSAQDWGLEQYEPSSGTLNPDTIKELEMELEKSVKKIVNASQEKGQKELGSDIFAFGNVLYRQHAKEWDNSYEEKWDALFPEMPVDVEVKSQILDAGLAIRPMQRR